jgi:dTMP kinase
MLTNELKYKFIVVEGIDGAGKSSIVKYLAEQLKHITPYINSGSGLGSGEMGPAIRARLMAMTLEEKDTSEVPLLYTALIDCYETFCMPEMDIDKTIILDRFIPSFYAYQCYARKDTTAINLFNNVLNNNDMFMVKPDLHIYCKVDVEKAQERVSSRNGLDVYDEFFLKQKQHISDGYDSYYNSMTTADIIELDCNVDLPFVKEKLDMLIKTWR